MVGLYSAKTAHCYRDFDTFPYFEKRPILRIKWGLFSTGALPTTSQLGYGNFILHMFFFQVTFLNSVIVDLQHKNEELKQRLEAMESGVVVNGAEDSMEVL